MITDEMRRELASKLRDAADDDGILDVGGMNRIMGWIGGPVDSIVDAAKLADLIDRPMCENVAEEGFLCSRCNWGDFEALRGVDVRYCPGCRAAIKEPAPRCLDADGVEIKPGDTVYYTGVHGAMRTGGPFEVVDVVGDGVFRYTDGSGKIHRAILPTSYSHRKYDSWEKLEEDAKSLDMCGYFGQGFARCAECPARGARDCRTEWIRDIVKRAKRLAGVA